MHLGRAGPLLVVLLLLPGCLETGADQGTPGYPELRQSPVRGLTESEIESLRAGEGMGYALAAELNGYPGPKHVLDLAKDLGLNESQRRSTQAVRNAMLGEAIRLGNQLVAAYEELDNAFRDGTITASRLILLTERIGALEGQLRSIHLAAHIEMFGILTHEQIRLYVELRGYGDGEHGAHH
jgi:hypothetical protein